MESQRGQVGIILLLITVVMMTIGISIASRTTSDIRISDTNEQANRALDAAETGVEDALSQDLSVYNGGTTGSTSQIDVSTTVGRQQVLETTIEPGLSVGVDVTGAPNNQQLTINWAKESDCTQQASLIVSVYNTGGSNPAVRRQYAGMKAGACSGRNTTDGFTQSNAGTASGYNLSTTITLLSGDTLVRIRPVYNETAIRVSGGAWLPVQMFKVKSTAQSIQSKETKAVEVDRGLPMPPTVFDYVLFSGGDITQ